MRLEVLEARPFLDDGEGVRAELGLIMHRPDDLGIGGDRILDTSFFLKSSRYHGEQDVENILTLARMRRNHRDDMYHEFILLRAATILKGVR